VAGNGKRQEPVVVVGFATSGRFETLTGRMGAGKSKAEMQKPAGSKTKYGMGEGWSHWLQTKARTHCLDVGCGRM
jgi:hypothetical protein